MWEVGFITNAVGGALPDNPYKVYNIFSQKLK
jgi:hypothetical protein